MLKTWLSLHCTACRDQPRCDELTYERSGKLLQSTTLQVVAPWRLNHIVLLPATVWVGCIPASPDNAQPAWDHHLLAELRGLRKGTMKCHFAEMPAVTDCLP